MYEEHGSGASFRAGEHSSAGEGVARAGEFDGVLREASPELAGIGSFAEAAERICGAGMKVLGASISWLALLTDEGGTGIIACVLSDGPAPAIGKGDPIGLCRAHAAALSSGSPVAVNDAACFSDSNPIPGAGLAVENALAAPLAIGGKKAGIIGFANRNGGFGESEARLAGALSDIAAAALHAHRRLETLAGAGEAQRIAFEAVPDAVVVFDVRGRIEYASRKMRELIGYDRDAELNGLSVFDFISPEDRSRAAERMRSVLSGEGPAETSYTLVRQGGASFPAEVRSIRKTGNNGVSTGVISVIRDVTKLLKKQDERRELIEKMLQKQKNEGLGALAGGVAQKFNSLLVTLIGHAEIALKILGDGSPAAANLEKISATARRMADISKQMLEFSGKGRFVLEPIDPSDLVESISRLLQAAAAEGAVVRCRLDRNCARIMGDRDKIRQAVINVATNASEALEGESGMITISTRDFTADSSFLASCRAADSAAPGPYVAIEIEDTGKGMSDETLSKAFEPFFSTRFPGRGLGLAAVLGIVTGHGGGVRIESKQGEGTKVTMFFPRSP